MLRGMRRGAPFNLLRDFTVHQKGAVSVLPNIRLDGVDKCATSGFGRPRKHGDPDCHDQPLEPRCFVSEDVAFTGPGREIVDDDIALWRHGALSRYTAHSIE